MCSKFEGKYIVIGVMRETLLGLDEKDKVTELAAFKFYFDAFNYAHNLAKRDLPS